MLPPVEEDEEDDDDEEDDEVQVPSTSITFPFFVSKNKLSYNFNTLGDDVVY